jgi:hypothetical protein
MKAHADTLAERRTVLLARSARLRAEIGADAAALETRFAVVDRVFIAGRSGWVRTLLTGAVALLMVTRTRRLISLASRLLVLYPLIRRGLALFSRRP